VEPVGGEHRAMTFQTVFRQRSVQQIAIIVAAIVLVLWTVFPFVWILLTSLKSPVDIISVPPKFLFTPTTDNYMALVMGEQHGQYASTRPDFPRFFLNSMIISFGAVAVSVAAGIPAAYALARFDFPLKNALAFVFMSFRFVPFIAFVIPLYLLFQQFGLYNTHAGLIFAYQLITLPFTIWMLRSFFQEIPLEIQDAAKIDGCSWLSVLTRVILPLSMPGIAVTVILGFMFSWNAFNYPLMLAGRQTFPVTVGAIQFISYEQVLWGQMAAATIVAAMPQLLLSLMVQKYIVRGLTMGAVR
jgi:multiple sugar transport system permease protein